MSEEEIIKIIKEKIILDFNCYNPIDKIELEAIQGILDLYNKEKEKNKELENKIKGKIEELQAMYDKLPKNPKEHLHSKTEYKIVIGELQELLEERN